MAFVTRFDLVRPDRHIDLAGTQGNAYYLMGLAKDLMKQLDYDKEEQDAVMDDMKSSDYKHLCQVFDDKFGSIFDLVIPEGDKVENWEREEDKS